MKKPRSNSRRKRVAVSALLDHKDETLDACRKMSTLGNLLAASDPGGDLSLEVVVQSGQMIADEANRLRELLKARRSF